MGLSGSLPLGAPLPCKNYERPLRREGEEVLASDWQTLLLKRHIFINMRIWRNWQTRMVQVHVRATSCRFKSCYPHQKKTLTLIKLRSFSTKSVLRRNKSATQMKSLRDEIRFHRDNKDGFNFIKVEGFDFIVLCTISQLEFSMILLLMRKASQKFWALT